MYVVDEKLPWLRVIFKIRGSVLPRIWVRMAFVTAIAIVNTAAREIWGVYEISLTTTPFVLIGLPLGVFLGFRNGASYDRFWEGRKLWGGFTNTSRTFARQALTLVQPGATVPGSTAHAPGEAAEVDAYRKELVRRAIAFMHAVRLHLRDQRGAFTAETEAFLPEGEARAFEGERNVPVAHLHRMGERLRDGWMRGWIHPMHLPALDAQLVTYMDLLGGCERIHNTALPFSYTILIHRIVAVYCLLLPFGVVETIHWATPIVVLFISYAFFGLDQIGDEIEDPFGVDVNDLALSAMTRNIEINLRQRLGDDPLPAAALPVNGVLS